MKNVVWSVLILITLGAGVISAYLLKQKDLFGAIVFLLVGFSSLILAKKCD